MLENENGNSRHEHRKDIINDLVNLVKEYQGTTFSNLLKNSPYSTSVTRRWLREMSVPPLEIIRYQKIGSRGEAEVWLDDQVEDKLKKLNLF